MPWYEASLQVRTPGWVESPKGQGRRPDGLPAPCSRLSALWRSHVVTTAVVAVESVRSPCSRPPPYVLAKQKDQFLLFVLVPAATVPAVKAQRGPSLMIRPPVGRQHRRRRRLPEPSRIVTSSPPETSRRRRCPVQLLALGMLAKGSSSYGGVEPRQFGWLYQWLVRHEALLVRMGGERPSISSPS